MKMYQNIAIYVLRENEKKKKPKDQLYFEGNVR